MALDPTIAKLITVGLVAGVAKSLFGAPRPVTHVHNHAAKSEPETSKENS